MMRQFNLTCVISFVAAFVSLPAAAYVGPGPGLSMIGSLFALIGSVAVALFMVVFWPARMYYKRWKKKKAAGATTPSKPENS